ncbi:hypothetical protein NZ045_32320 [Bacillus sp. FSL L8-0287]|uniref:hypothetical protein n=1 Tax=Bacillus sp. FSL L8-0287 TaxID=2976835 RepID=UPI0030FA9CDD
MKSLSNQILTGFRYFSIGAILLGLLFSVSMNFHYMDVMAQDSKEVQNVKNALNDVQNNQDKKFIVKENNHFVSSVVTQDINRKFLIVDKLLKDFNMDLYAGNGFESFKNNLVDEYFTDVFAAKNNDVLKRVYDGLMTIKESKNTYLDRASYYIDGDILYIQADLYSVRDGKQIRNGEVVVFKVNLTDVTTTSKKFIDDISLANTDLLKLEFPAM